MEQRKIKMFGIFCLQLIVLTAIYQFGNLVSQYFHLEIPGSVIGMIILFSLLWLGVIKMEYIQHAANWLLKHLGFFFIPIAVGLMTLGPTMVQHGIPFLLVLSVSAVLGIVSAGRATQWMINKRKEVNVKPHDHSV